MPFIKRVYRKFWILKQTNKKRDFKKTKKQNKNKKQNKTKCEIALMPEMNLDDIFGKKNSVKYEKSDT